MSSVVTCQSLGHVEATVEIHISLHNIHMHAICVPT